jgi:carotenoid cleavage dioxygenase-like enzyme
VQFGDLSGIVGLLILLWKSACASMFPDTRLKPHPAVGEGDRERNSWQNGNTALVFHNRKLLALMEGAYPFLLKVRRQRSEIIIL